MDFISYSTQWAKSEVTQAYVMIGIGLLLAMSLFFIIRGEHEVLKGASIPLGLLTTVLIFYGGYILQSRPAHSKSSIELYQSSPSEAIQKEREKHINDNKTGKMLMRYVYPGMILLSVLGLFFSNTPIHKGLALGIILLAVGAYIMDYGFVSRSDGFIRFLDTLNH